MPQATPGSQFILDGAMILGVMGTLGSVIGTLFWLLVRRLEREIVARDERIGILERRVETLQEALVRAVSAGEKATEMAAGRTRVR